MNHFIKQIKVPIRNFLVKSVPVDEIHQSYTKFKKEIFFTNHPGEMDEVFNILGERVKNFPIEILLSNESINLDLPKLPKIEVQFNKSRILGEYCGENKKIYYYNLSYSELDVVKIHERYHAIHHLIPDPNDGSIWTNFPFVPSFYKELLSQLFTFRYCSDFKRKNLNYFFTLNSNQGALYQTWKIFKDFSCPKIIELYWEIRRRLNSGKRIPIFEDVTEILLGTEYKFALNNESQTAYWLVGATWAGVDCSEIFSRSGYWELGWKDSDKPKYAKMRNSIKKGDRIAIKSMRGRGASTITIKAIGIVKKIGENKKIYINWIFKDMNREVDSRGCFGSIHGPYYLMKNWNWISTIFLDNLNTLAPARNKRCRG